MKSNNEIPNEELASVAMLDASVFSMHHVKDAIPTDWHERAQKAWEYYLEEPIVSNAINAWRVFALGDEVSVSSDDEKTEETATEAFDRLHINRFVKDMVLQLLVKGDAVGYFNRNESGDDLARVTCVNPSSVKLSFEDGQLTQARQRREISPGQFASTDDGQELPLDQLLHIKWNAPEFSPRGNSMILPAFDAIELLRDFRRTERAIAKRWATPLRFIQVGGVFGGKLINPDQATLQKIQQELNKMDLKQGMVVPFYVKAETYGADGHVLQTEKKIQETKEDIVVALGMARGVVTGDGPNFATASVSLQKMVVQLKEIKQAAREILDWVFDEWGDLTGHSAGLHYGFSDLDLASEEGQRKLLIELYDRGLISRKTLQQKMGLSPDIELREREGEEVIVDRNWSVQEITQLVALEIISPAEARRRLGVDALIGGPDEAGGEHGDGLAEADALYANAPTR